MGKPGVSYARKWSGGDDVRDLIVPPAPKPVAPAESPRLTKICPDCAETILQEARICRFCRHECRPAMPEQPAPFAVSLREPVR
jgi:hypothetical protein